MIFQTVVLLLIILCTLFWAWQGAFSATLMFIAGLLASVLAAGLYEDFVPEFSKFRPDYAQPVMFFLIFAFAFSVLRMANGVVAPRNIHLPRYFDLGVGAAMGFLTALVTIGTLVIGVEMIPGHQNILGYDRFPNGMGKDPAKLWIGADDFVTWVWSMSSGGSLGGDAYTADHPDLGQELYGDRHVVQFGSYPAVPQDRFSVPAVFAVSTPNAIKALHIGGLAADSPVKVVIVRSQITKGNDVPDVSCDHDNNYRITPMEVRLVTTPTEDGTAPLFMQVQEGGGVQLVEGPKGHPAQYYPIGYMAYSDGQTKFTPLDINRGHLVEDYTIADADLVNDWVFVVPADAKPRLFAEKQIAQQDITSLADTAKQDVYAAAPSTAYPPMSFLNDLPTIQISVRRSIGEATNQPVVGQDVYLLRPGIIKRRIHPAINTAWDAIDQSESPYKQGILQRFRDIKVQKSEDDIVQISEFIQLLLYANETKDRNEDLRQADHYINDKLMPILLDPDKDLVVWQTKTDENGKTPEKHIAPGDYVIVTWSVDRAKDDFHFWAVGVRLAKQNGNSLILEEMNDRTVSYKR